MNISVTNDNNCISEYFFNAQEYFLDKRIQPKNGTIGLSLFILFNETYVAINALDVTVLLQDRELNRMSTIRTYIEEGKRYSFRLFLSDNRTLVIETGHDDELRIKVIRILDDSGDYSESDGSIYTRYMKMKNSDAVKLLKLISEFRAKHK